MGIQTQSLRSSDLVLCPASADSLQKFNLNRTWDKGLQERVRSNTLEATCKHGSQQGGVGLQSSAVE